jgi:poly(hydroxyalkanoate) granule-associated protein
MAMARPQTSGAIMVTKMKKSTAADTGTDTGSGAESGTEARGSRKSQAQLADTVKESAQQIWLAGLGAFAKAQEEGGKVFEALVKEGTSMQRKTQAAAEEKITEATSRMANMATDISSKASGQWDKLETIFEQRVSKALNKLGVPSSKDIDALVERIDELNRNVARLNAKAAGGAGRAAKQPANSTPKPATKRASARKAS